MIEKITDQNLERYDSRLKEWCDKKFFEKGNYGKYQITEEAGAVAFYPAPNTPLEGKVKFSFKETMPASGDKGPENPSTITGVSEINVYRANSNMLLFPYSDTKRTAETLLMIANPDGSIDITGKKTSGNDYYRFFAGYNDNDAGFPIKTGISYYNTSKGDAQNFPIRLYRDTAGIDYSIRAGQSIISEVSRKITCALKYTKNADYTGIHKIVYPSISIIPYAGEWEFPETVRYQIPLGSTYYGGTLDVASGVMTVTHGYKIGVDTYQANEKTNTVGLSISIGTDAVVDYNGIACDKFAVASGMDDYEHMRIKTGGQNVEVYVNKSRLTFVDSWINAGKAWLAANPVGFTFKLATPYTVQLTSQQIFSLTQIDKYTPRLNTVYTDADSVQISYLKSPIRDEYEKTQAILSLGGNS